MKQNRLKVSECFTVYKYGVEVFNSSMIWKEMFYLMMHSTRFYYLQLNGV